MYRGKMNLRFTLKHSLHFYHSSMTNIYKKMECKVNDK